MMVCEMLREIRNKAGLTQKEVAEKIFVSRTAYVQYETGKRTVSAEMFFNIMKALEESFYVSNWKNEFFDAIEQGNLEMVKKYAEDGLDIESLNEFGERPFLSACLNNQADILQYLIEKGSPYESISDIDWKERNGSDKFFYALNNGDLKVAKVLLSHFNLEAEIRFAKGMGMGFLPLKSKLFVQFLEQEQEIPLDKIEELAKRLGEIDKDKLIKEHIPLAESMIKRYKKEGRIANLSDDELKNAAMDGLKMAADKYDPDKGFQFKTYSHWWIRRGIMKKKVEKTGLPIHLYDYYVKFQQANEEELKVKGKGLTKEKLCEIFEVKMELLEKIKDRYTEKVFWENE